jgi:hypothetical protein
MSTRPKGIAQAKQNKKIHKKTILDHGPDPLKGSELLSKDGSLPSSDPDPRPPKIPDMIEFGLSDSSVVAGLKRAFGTKDLDSICHLITQLFPTNPRFNLDEPTSWNPLLAMVHDIAPKDSLEGLLAVQMVGVHQAAMEFLGRSMAGSGTLQATDANVNRANKFLRTFAALLEALNRHRGKITPPMVVGNVNVSDGGQAIVGSVNHPGSGKASKDNEEKRVG